MADVTSLYLQAPVLREAGERVVSTDEMTGIQALERKHPTIPMGPGRVERREFEYLRHGTLTLIANFDVACGQVIAPSLGPTRTEEDFVAHLARTVASDPEATRWHFVADNLNIHQSESLVRFVAKHGSRLIWAKRRRVAFSNRWPRVPRFYPIPRIALCSTIPRNMLPG